MYLLFEGKQYDKDQLNIIKLDSHFFSDTNPCVVDKCGYCRPSNTETPVFCLPKVFIKANNKFLGEYEIDKIIDTQAEEFYDNSSVRDVIFSLSSWLYAALRTYQRRMPNKSLETSIVTESGSQNILSNIDEDDYTQLDVIMALNDFYKKNSSLFIKIARDAHSNLSQINWSKTVNSSLPFFQDGQPIYMEMKGKRKEINYDEVLITLFFSTLNYISEKLGIFEYDKPIGYKLYPISYIEDGKDSGSIERLLLRIKHNYFSDRMRYLWQLLFMFYSQEEGSSTEQDGSKYLLVKSFQNVFEDMVEFLIGDSDLPDVKLKIQKDGHLIDHIFKYNSLIFKEEEIYYVGDSKYYKETSDIQEYSEEKQYTYAHNVIKYNMDFFRNPRLGNFKDFIGGTRYRDELTEGYSITPNFFISGIIKDPTDYYNNDFDLRRDKNGKPESPKQSSYYDDRLFDRDTLFLQHYDINFLYVLASYVSGNNVDRNIFKAELQEKLRNNFISFFNDRYCFYKIEVTKINKFDFVEKFFRVLIGKMFQTSEGLLILALENKIEYKTTHSNLIDKISNYCNLIPFKLS